MKYYWKKVVYRNLITSTRRRFLFMCQRGGSRRREFFKYDWFYRSLFLTGLFKMLKNGQTYFKNFAVFTPQDFKAMFGYFSTLCMKGLIISFSISSWSFFKQTVHAVKKHWQLSGKQSSVLNKKDFKHRCP